MIAEGTLIGGRYRLVQQIGRGRIGFVWIAQDAQLNRTVAAKQLPLPRTSPAMAAQARALAAQQARRAAAFKHGGAVTVYDVLTDGEDVWTITEYVPSRTMADFLVGHGRLTPAQAASLGAQLADTLATAHRGYLTHGAMEPAVVLLADDGGVQLTDFAVGVLTQDPAFRAPEVRKGLPTTPACDVFSLGATLYRAVEGAAPFGPNGADIGPPVASTTDDLHHVVLRMLSQNPALRPNMAGVADALAAVADGRKPAHEALAASLPLTQAALAAGPHPPLPTPATAAPVASPASPSPPTTPAAAPRSVPARPDADTDGPFTSPIPVRASQQVPIWPTEEPPGEAFTTGDWPSTPVSCSLSSRSLPRRRQGGTRRSSGS